MKKIFNANNLTWYKTTSSSADETKS